MLAASPTAAREGLPAEEYAIHDYEGYGPIHLGEHESLERVCALAGMIDEHGDIFAVWYDQADGRHYDDPADRFAETYRGSFPSLADYAEELVSGDVSPKILNAPLLWGTVGGFIDYDQIAHDLECSGEILTIDHDGMVHVWCTS
jgi:antirestriction protein